MARDTYQGVITSQSYWQFSFGRMSSDYLSDRFCDFRHKSWVFQDANRRVVNSIDLFELMVSIELDFPSELSKLINNACFYQVNWAFVDTGFWLNKSACQPCSLEMERCVTWPPLDII